MTAEEQMRHLRSAQAVRSAQEYVSQALRLDGRIALKLAQLDAMREKHSRLCRALGRPPEDQPPELKAREDDVLSDYSALLRLQQEISSRIRRVPDERHRSVLELRYLEGMPFFRIAMKMHYDERTIYGFHRAGLRHIAAQLMQEKN